MEDLLISNGLVQFKKEKINEVLRNCSGTTHQCTHTSDPVYGKILEDYIDITTANKSFKPQKPNNVKQSEIESSQEESPSLLRRKIFKTFQLKVFEFSIKLYTK